MRTGIPILAAIAATLLSLLLTARIALADMHYCDHTARLVAQACHLESRDDYALAAAACFNLSDDEERAECYDDARNDSADARDECGEQLDARLELCDLLGGEQYDPDWSPENFVDPREIGGTVEPNPYLPLLEGMTRIYEKEFEEDGEMVVEVITVLVTDEIKHIDGVDCRVISDIVTIDGELVENTDDWMAQDLEGNVWYCGEQSRDYEYFDGDDPETAELVSIDGSFKAGVDGALAGILMLANPQVGDAYREEVSFNNAEDAAEIVSIDADESVPAASCGGVCVIVRAFTPLEPGVEELKYYAPGIGPILELDDEGNRTELTSLILP